MNLETAIDRTLGGLTAWRPCNSTAAQIHRNGEVVRVWKTNRELCETFSVPGGFARDSLREYVKASTPGGEETLRSTIREEMNRTAPACRLPRDTQPERLRRPPSRLIHFYDHRVQLHPGASRLHLNRH